MLQIPRIKSKSKLISVAEAYEYCRLITAEYAKTFYLGTLLMPKEKRKALIRAVLNQSFIPENKSSPMSIQTGSEALPLPESKETVEVCVQTDRSP